MTSNQSDMTTMQRAAADLRHRSTWFKIGWWFLVLITAISVVGHLLLPVTSTPADETLMFWALAAMSSYALAVVLVPFRRGERWAWWVTWVLVATYAVVIFSAPPDVGATYLSIAALMAVAQLATRPAFEKP